MTVSVVASASVGNTNNTDVTSVICNKPTGTVSGDFMVAVFTAPYTGSLTYTPPSGWTLVDSQNGGGSVSLWSGLYTKTAGGSEPSTYTWQCSGAGSMTVGIITYRGTDGTFNSTSTSNPRKNSGTTTNPQVISPLTTITGTGLATYACSWHDAGGSGDISSGSASQASTERWDLARTDGSPSTHERGSSCYTLDAEFTNGSNNPTSGSITLSTPPTSYVNWTWGLNSVASGGVASTLGGVTASMAGTSSAVTYTGTIASTLGGATSASTATVIPVGLSIVGSSSYNNPTGTDVSTVVIPKVTNIASGDFMVAVVNGPYDGSHTWSAPAGWTLVNQANAGAVSLESLLYTKTATGSEPSSYTWTYGGTAGAMNGGIVAYRGTAGFTTPSTGTNPKVSTGTTANPQTMPNLASESKSGRTTFAVAWHAGASAAYTSTGNAGAEQFDIKASDAANAHSRGAAAYVYSTPFSAGSNNSGAATTLTGAPTSYVAWTWALEDIHTGTAASTLGSITASMTGNGRIPQGSISSTLGGVTGAFTGKVTGVRVEMLINGMWTDITEYVRYNDGISITRGGSAESTTMTTGLCSMTLDNREDTAQSRFSQQNPLSPYYGYIGRNTQIRVTKVESAPGYRFWGEISSWEPGADDTDTDRYVAIEASGIVRRLEAVVSPLLPAIEREIMNGSPKAYWPCDEQKGATQIASGLVGGARIAVKGTPDYASYTALATAGPMPQIGSSVWSSPILKGVDYTNGVTLSFLMSIPENGIASTSAIMKIPYYYTSTAFPDGNTGYLALEMLDTGFLYANGFPLSGSSGAATANVPLVGTNGVMIYLAIQKATSASFNFGLWYQGEDDASPVLVDTSAWNSGAGGAISNDAIKSFVFNPDQLSFGTTASLYIGHIAQWNGYGPGDDDVPEFASVGAYSGEPAGTRFTRICTEEGIDVTVNNPTDSSAMGPQLAKTTVALLRECEATDMGVMYEQRNGLGLGYIVRRDLYNKASDLTLDYSNGELDSQLKPVYDDKSVQNDVTVQRDGGSSARYETTVGSMSVNDPPGGAGRYDTSITVSLDDDSRCYAQAGWRARLGSVEGARITSVGIEMANKRFAADLALSSDAYAVDSGSKVTVTNPPEWSGQEVNQIVRGYSERFNAQTHQITFNTAPASPYDTAVAVTTPTTTTAKADSLTTTLHADVTDSATSFTVDVTGVLWSLTAGDFDINIGGERMTVTSVTGTSSPQTFNVTRAVNGIAKAHTAGDQVRLWKPAYVAL